mmetsp:Transcript_14214/g.40321  ORF Transcript_14214/g.40321 Transcript_14214/m.40321 type:complete len:215 (-) Transcript_14214:645-1289(-)
MGLDGVHPDRGGGDRVRRQALLPEACQRLKVLISPSLSLWVRAWRAWRGCSVLQFQYDSLGLLAQDVERGSKELLGRDDPRAFNSKNIMLLLLPQLKLVLPLVLRGEGPDPLQTLQRRLLGGLQARRTHGEDGRAKSLEELLRRSAGHVLKENDLRAEAVPRRGHGRPLGVLGPRPFGAVGFQLDLLPSAKFCDQNILVHRPHGVRFQLRRRVL